MNNQYFQEQFTTLQTSIDTIISTKLGEGVKKLDPLYTNNFEIYKKNLLDAQKAFIEANEKALKKAKDDKEKQVILENLKLIWQLLKNPTDDATIQKCREQAKRIDDPLSPFWVGLGIALIIALPLNFGFVILLSTFLSTVVPATAPGILIIGILISAAFIVAVMWLEINVSFGILNGQFSANERSSSLTQFTNIVTESHVTEFNLFSEKPDNSPTLDSEETHVECDLHSVYTSRH